MELELVLFYSYNRAIVKSRLRSRCATLDVYLLILIAEQNLVEIDAVVSFAA